MSINKRLKFELTTIMDRINEIRIEYNDQPSRCGPILNTRMNSRTGYIRVSFKDHAYLIFVYKHAYMFIWFSKKDDSYYIQDGCITCNDVSQVCRELHDRIFSGFSPSRGLAWHMYGMPRNTLKKK
jgi:hypothetical protein